MNSSRGNNGTPAVHHDDFNAQEQSLNDLRNASATALAKLNHKRMNTMNLWRNNNGEIHVDRQKEIATLRELQQRLVDANVRVELLMDRLEMSSDAVMLPSVEAHGSTSGRRQDLPFKGLQFGEDKNEDMSDGHSDVSLEYGFFPIDISALMTTKEQEDTRKIHSHSFSHRKLICDYFEKKIISENLDRIIPNRPAPDGLRCFLCDKIGKHFTAFCPNVMTLSERKKIWSESRNLKRMFSGNLCLCDTKVPLVFCPKVLEVLRMRKIIDGFRNIHSSDWY